MIQITNLTKIYKTKKKNNHKALDNINLALPNTGLIFVIGKSGSGKSTLLNLLGGLDNITSGNIIIDGNDITTFNESNLANYRNNHIGFIFQDYHLLDELTVYENICLSLNLNKIEDNGKVSDALEKVGLSGYENRYPQELSGGERQRVAIARAIVKKPHIILADEPTGNLDNETGTQIVELLKKLSQECLILIVSHNTIDTYKYADRIIKLSNGKIISDESRNPEYLDEIKYDNNIVYYPMDKTLSNDDISKINNKLSSSNVKEIVGINNKYVTTKKETLKEEKVEFDNSNLSLKNTFKLSITFLKSKILRIVLSSLMIAAIMVIFALAETIITFDSGEVIQKEMNKMNQNAIYMEKFADEQLQEQLAEKFYLEVSHEDIEKFKTSGYKGKIYEVLNLTVSSNNSASFAGWQKPAFTNSIYLIETLGTIVVDEEFLKDKFGEIEYVAKLDEFNPAGVIITDYFADAILSYKAKKGAVEYNDLLGEYFYSGNLNHTRGYINAIIKTNYQEENKELIEKFKTGQFKNISDLLELDLFKELTNDIYTRLGFCYSTNPNFVNDFNKADTYKTVWHYQLKIDDKVLGDTTSPQIWLDELLKYDLKENEVIMHYKKYNEIFGTEYTTSNLKTFTPHKIKIQQFRYFDTEFKEQLLEAEVTITALTSTGSNTFIVNDQLYWQFKDNLLITKGLYFDGNENVYSIIKVANELNFEEKMFIIEGIHTMTKAVDVFIPIFELVAIVLSGGIILILISFSTKMIKDKMHDIGILKALGCKNHKIGTIFGIQLILVALLTIIMSTIGYFIFIDLANDVLIESLNKLAPARIVLNLEFLTFKPNLVFMNSILITILVTISFIIPMIKIYKIEPVQIIKNKE